MASRRMISWSRAIGSKEYCGCNGGHKHSGGGPNGRSRAGELPAPCCSPMMPHLEKLVQQVGVLEGENRQLK